MDKCRFVFGRWSEGKTENSYTNDIALFCHSWITEIEWARVRVVGSGMHASI